MSKKINYYAWAVPQKAHLIDVGVRRVCSKPGPSDTQLVALLWGELELFITARPTKKDKSKMFKTSSIPRAVNLGTAINTQMSSTLLISAPVFCASINLSCMCLNPKRATFLYVTGYFLKASLWAAAVWFSHSNKAQQACKMWIFSACQNSSSNDTSLDVSSFFHIPWKTKGFKCKELISQSVYSRSRAHLKKHN